MQSTPSMTSIALPRPVRVFWWLSAIISIVCLLVMVYNKLVLHLHAPYVTPFFPFNGYCDLLDFKRRFSHYHQLDFFSTAKTRGTVFSYPAPVGLLYEMFFLWPAHAHLLYVAITTTLFLTLAALLGRAMVRRGTSLIGTSFFLATSFLMSYPFWLNYLLGNLEIMIVVILGFGVVAFLRGHFYIAAALIGVAGSMKLFPFVFLGLFLSRRQYRQFAAAIVTGAALYPASIWMECPSFAVAREGMRAGAEAMSEGLILRWHATETGFDHSLFGFTKQIVHRRFEDLMPVRFLDIYMVVAALAGVAIYFLLIRRLPVLNQILSLYIAAILLPPMSHDYTLLHLYIPWGLFILFAVDCKKEGRRIPGLLAVFVCFGLLFAPESEFIYHGARLAGQIKAVELAVLWFVSLRYRFEAEPEELLGRSAEGKNERVFMPVFSR